MPTICRSTSLSLQEAWQQWASRSFHLGPLTVRDLFPVLVWCKVVAYDFNTLEDKAYVPTKLVFEWKIQSLHIQSNTRYVVSSLLMTPPKVNNPFIDDLLLEAFEKNKTLWWFWMHLNSQVFQDRPLITFSEKIVWNEKLISRALNTLIARGNDQLLADMFSRYMIAWSVICNIVCISGDRLHYDSMEWGEISIHKQDIISSCMNLFTHWSKLSRLKKWDCMNLIEECSWPLFSIELTSALNFLIDSFNKGDGTVPHIWWQAMYGYIQSQTFKERFDQYVNLINGDHTVTDGIKMESMEILPAHFFRFLTFTPKINTILKEWAIMIETLENIKKEKSDLMRWWYTIASDEVKALLLQETQTKKSQQLSLGEIKNYEEIRRMPSDTFRYGVLNQPYQSQLDYLWMTNQWFDPEQERKFLSKIPINQVEWLIKKII